MQSDLLDVVIGVVFVWFCLSVMLSAVNEAFSLSTHLRAKHLWLGIGRLLDPSSSRLPRTFLDAVVRLPLLGRGDLRPRTASDGASSAARRASTARALDGPREVGGVRSWMALAPDRRAAKAELETPEWAALRDRTNALYERLGPQLVEIAKPGRLSKVTHIASDAVADAIIALAKSVHPADLVEEAKRSRWKVARREALNEALGAAGYAANDTLSADLALPAPADDKLAWSRTELLDLYERATKGLTPQDVVDYFADHPVLARTLGDIVTDLGVAEQLTAMKAAIDKHFNREMEQVSRFYQRQNRKILAVFASVAVVLLQANSIGLALDLWHDTHLRAAVSSAAVGAAAHDSVKSAIGLENCGSPTATTTTTRPAVTTSTTNPFQEARGRLNCAADIIGKTTKFHVGWGGNDFRDAHGTKGEHARGEVADVWPYLFGNWGWAGRPITAIALLFGAQFWFDILRRLVGLKKTLAPEK